MIRKYDLFIYDIFKSIMKIEKFIKTMSFGDFEKDDKTISAVIREIEIIGEASKNIPDNIKEKYDTLPWSQMARMRDKLIHWYFGIDNNIVWKTITERLPELKKEIKSIIKDLKNEVNDETI